MSTFSVLFYVFTGALSLSYMLFGKKQRKAVALLAGLGLGILPYFGLEMWQMVIGAVILIVLPFMLKV